VFEQNSDPIQTIFKAATAFTHPRRIEIFRAVKNGSQTLEQLRAVTRISAPALRRHLKKLEARGFVRCRPEICLAAPPDALGRELARLAGE
jgi:predicted ArsR family transcriptional regulator